MPHFEKMLYDNALLARAYGEAGLVCDRPEWVAVARATADYLLRRDARAGGSVLLLHRRRQRGTRGAVLHLDPGAGARGPRGGGGRARDGGLRPRLRRRPDDEAQVLRPSRPLAEVAAELGLEPGQAAGRLAAARERLLAARRAASAARHRRQAPDGLERDGGVVARLPRGGASRAPLCRRGRRGRPLPPRPRRSRRAPAAIVAGGRRLGRRDARGRRLGRGGVRPALRGRRRRRRGWRPPGRSSGAGCRTTRGRRGRSTTRPTTGRALPVRPRAPADGATPAPAGVMAGALLRLAALTGEEGLRAAAARAVAADAALVTRAPRRAGRWCRRRRPPPRRRRPSSWSETRAGRRPGAGCPPPGGTNRRAAFVAPAASVPVTPRGHAGRAPVRRAGDRRFRPRPRLPLRGRRAAVSPSRNRRRLRACSPRPGS